MRELRHLGALVLLCLLDVLLLGFCEYRWIIWTNISSVAVLVTSPSLLVGGIAVLLSSAMSAVVGGSVLLALTSMLLVAVSVALLADLLLPTLFVRGCIASLAIVCLLLLAAPGWWTPLQIIANIIIVCLVVRILGTEKAV